MRGAIAVVGFLMLLFSSSGARGEILKLCLVVEKGTPGAEEMEFIREEKKETLYVLTKPILTEDQVKHAGPFYGWDGVITLRLDEAGGKAMRTATEKMKLGKDRIAIIVEGKLVSAPVVQAILGSQISIEGLDGIEEAQRLARQLMGEEEPVVEENAEEPPFQFPEQIPYTEEEYLERKAAREQMGLFHLEAVPTEEELEEILRVGMPRKKLLKKLGRPSWKMKGTEEGTETWNYQLAPEKHPATKEEHHSGFDVRLVAKKVVGWGMISSNMTREMRLKNPPKTTLRMIYPEVDFSSGEVDMIAYIEECEIVPADEPWTKADLSQVMGMVNMACSAPGEEVLLDVKCDLVAFLIQNIPELEALALKSKNGKITGAGFSEAIMPYLMYEKEMPVPKAELVK